MSNTAGSRVSGPRGRLSSVGSVIYFRMVVMRRAARRSARLGVRVGSSAAQACAPQPRLHYPFAPCKSALPTTARTQSRATRPRRPPNETRGGCFRISSEILRPPADAAERKNTTGGRRSQTRIKINREQCGQVPAHRLHNRLRPLNNAPAAA